MRQHSIPSDEQRKQESSLCEGTKVQVRQAGGTTSTTARQGTCRNGNTRKRQGKKDKNVRKMEKEKARNSFRGMLSIYYVLHDLREDSSNSKE